jgi:hypothetical protein
MKKYFKIKALKKLKQNAYYRQLKKEYKDDECFILYVMIEELLRYMREGTYTKEQEELHHYAFKYGIFSYRENGK